jgi:hypothetical protein
MSAGFTPCRAVPTHLDVFGPVPTLLTVLTVLTVLTGFRPCPPVTA